MYGMPLALCSYDMSTVCHLPIRSTTLVHPMALLTLVFFHAGCGLQPASDTGGDQSAQQVGPVFASDCGVESDAVLFGGQCMPAQEHMWVPDQADRNAPWPRSTALHPAMLEAGHPQDNPVTVLPEAQDVDWNGYVRWAADVVVRPVLKLEEGSLVQGLGQFAQQVDQGSDAVLEKAASLASVYANLELIDESLTAVSKQAGVDGAQLWECKQLWETFRFAAPGTSQAFQERHLRPEIDGCLDTFDRTLGALKALQHHYGTQHPGEALVSLGDLDTQVQMVSRTRGALSDSRISVALRQRIKELPSAVLTLFHLATDPLVLSQSFYPLLRYPVRVLVDGAPWDGYVPFDDGSTREVNAPLGSIAQALVRSYTDTISVIADYGDAQREFFESLTPEQQAGEITKIRAWHIKLYIAAMTQALQGSLTQNRSLQASVANFTEGQAWVLALAVDAMGAMSLYGGYDGSGEPIGYQAMHDVLMAQAHDLKSSKRLSLFTVASSVACIGSAIVAGIAASPIASLAALGICAVATASGVTEAVLLGRLSSAAMQLGFMGREYALYPPQQATELRAQASVSTTLAVLDVLAMGFDVMDAQRAFRAGHMWTEADDVAPAALFARRAEVRQALASAAQAGTSLRHRLANIWHSIPKPSLAWGGSAVSWDDVDIIRANLRRFTSDTTALETLVQRTQSLNAHGVGELYSPELTRGQMAWFLDNPNYVPKETYRQVFERILTNTRIISWEEFVYALSRVWDEFRSTLSNGDQVVFIKATMFSVADRPIPKSNDFILSLIQDWYAHDTVDLSRFFEVRGFGGGLNAGALQALADTTAASGHTLHLVYLDDWVLTGTQAYENIEGMRKLFPNVSADYHVVVPFATNNAAQLLADLSISVTSPVRLSTLSDLFPPTDPLYATVTDMAGSRTSLRWPDHTFHVLPYHMGDSLNGFQLAMSGNKLAYPLTGREGSPHDLLMEFIGVRTAPVPY